MTEENRAAPAEKQTGRIEAFSDGVFAVAITLLVLDLIKVPEAPEGQVFTAADLAAILGRQWPSYATFLISFATILIMWMNHHSIFQWVQQNDPVFMFANGFLLLLVTLVPFPTALLGDYLLKPAAPTAAAMYAGLFVIISIAFIVLWWAAAYRRPLLRPGIPPARIRERTIANLLGFPVYVLALACAFWSPVLTVAICGALWIFWAIISIRL
jgi:uncharacterized membrane protein